MDMPTLALQGWVSPNQHNMTVIDGQPHHVVVQPDPSASVVNRLGNHSIRGGHFGSQGPQSRRAHHRPAQDTPPAGQRAAHAGVLG